METNDSVLDRYESEWRSGSTPDLSRFIAENDIQELSLLWELVRIDLDRQIRHGNLLDTNDRTVVFRAEVYRDAITNWILGDSANNQSIPIPVEVLETEMRSRWCVMDPVGVSEYFRRFPDLDDEAAKRLRVVYVECLTSGDVPDDLDFVRESGISATEFVERLISSRLRSAEFINKRWRDLTVSKRSAYQLATSLQRENSLTAFQAHCLVTGNGVRLKIGQYSILDVIGRGGMGVVYLARHDDMGRDVALKTISVARAKHSDTRKRFHREVQAVSRLSHPNIVTAHDAGFDEEMGHLVMELIHGRDLASWVQTEGPFSPSTAVRYAMQAARALGYAHRMGVIHRDVKPSNLMLDERNDVKLLDLGLAQISGDSSGSGITREGQVVGTLQYLSPEQLAGEGRCDQRCDVYALGCTLFYLLTGESLIAGSSPAEIVTAHTTGKRRLLSDYDVCGSVRLQYLIEKMTAVDPRDRFTTMSEVEKSLQGWLESSHVNYPIMNTETGRTSDASTITVKQSIFKEQQATNLRLSGNLQSFVAVLTGGVGGVLFLWIFGHRWLASFVEWLR